MNKARGYSPLHASQLCIDTAGLLCLVTFCIHWLRNMEQISVRYIVPQRCCYVSYWSTLCAMIPNARETMPEGKNVGSVAAMYLDCFDFASLAMVCLDEIWPGLCESLGTFANLCEHR